MREVFQQELREVQDRLVQIAELVETAIQQRSEEHTSELQSH